MKFITATSFFYIANAASLSADDPSDVVIDFTCAGKDSFTDPIQVSLRALNKVGRADSSFSYMFPEETEDGEPPVIPIDGLSIPLIAPRGISCNLVKEVLQWIDLFKVDSTTLPTIARPLEKGRNPRETLKNSGFDSNYFKLVENQDGLKSFEELLLMSTLAEYLGFAKVKEVVNAAMAAELWERSLNGTIRDIFSNRSSAPVLPIHAHPKGYEAAEEGKDGEPSTETDIVESAGTEKSVPAAGGGRSWKLTRWPKMKGLKKLFRL